MFYKPLATVQIKHDFYADGLCPDFEIVPTEQTRRALRDCKLLCKVSEQGLLQIFHPVTDKNSTEILFPMAGFTFCFFLVLKNNTFATFTQMLSGPLRKNEVWVWEKKLADVTLVRRAYLKSAKILSQWTDAPSPSQPLTLTLQKDGEILQTQEISDEQSQETSFNLLKTNTLSTELLDDGEYQVHKNWNDLDSFESFRWNGALARHWASVASRAWGLVALELDAPLGSPLEIPFVAQSKQWDYFLVLPQADVRTFEIKDTRPGSNVQFLAASDVTAQMQGTLPQLSGKKILKISSNGSINWREKLNILPKLTSNIDSSGMLLPLPSAHRPQAQCFIQL
jgi:hypothetical protein